MSKYSEEYKLRVVKAYISGEGGTETVAKKYKVARTCLQQWVAQYELTGSFTKPTENNKASIASGNSVYGGALFLSSCTVNITGGIFTNNSTIPEGSNTNTQFYGGAIYIIGSGTDTNFAIISGCDFAGNSAYQNGGAIYTGGNSYININNSSFENNTVLNDTAQGSAVYINNMDGNITINNCEFISNTTSDIIFTVYNGSTSVTHLVNGSDLPPESGYNPN